MKWLIFFYSVPSKPVSSRMKIWRRLAKAGAAQLKGAVYILPNNDENYELCQWLVSEVASMKGDGAFVGVRRIETMKDQDIIALFNRQREKDYNVIGRDLEGIERKISSIRKGTGTQGGKKLSGQLNKHLKEIEDIRGIDFFASGAGSALIKRLEALQKEMRRLSETGNRQTPDVKSCRTEDYRGKRWVTRKNPFIDRMASAWLIKKFIDKKAVFQFINEKDMDKLSEDEVTFDIRGGRFTHAADMCTFEALVKAFEIKDKAVRKIAGIVHELDIRDEKYHNAEARGIEEILSGLRKAVKDDAELLEKGMSVFEMLYRSKAG